MLIHLDATSLYPSAMWDDENVHLKIVTGFVFTVDMNGESFEKFSNNFNQGSAVSKVKYYIPPDIIFKHLPVKERVQKVEVNPMRNGYIIDTLTFADIKQLILSVGEIVRKYEGVIYGENFRMNPFKRLIGKLYEYKNIIKIKVMKFWS